MNIELIKKKLGHYYVTATPEQIIKEFEALGVKFKDMTLAEQLLDKLQAYFVESQELQHDTTYLKEDILEVMKKYGRLMCNKQKYICAETANIQINTGTRIYYQNEFNSKEFGKHESFVNRNSILEAKYPKELL